MSKDYLDVAIKPTREVNQETLKMLSAQLKKTRGEIVTELIVQRYGAMIEKYLLFQSSVAQAQQAQQQDKQS